MRPVITLTSDFGGNDGYVAAMKGTMLAILPEVRFVDISHSITPFDVMEAAFVLRRAVPYFPQGTTHLVVVDPGVGSERRPIALRHNGHNYVGPDNGLFTLVLGEDAPTKIVTLDRPECYRDLAPSQTFHGRDIFAPIAAHLAGGKPLDSLGSPVHGLKPLHWALPIDDQQGIRGWIVHIDRFGNCITNITRKMLDKRRGDRSLKCFVGNAILRKVHRTYSEVDKGAPLLLFDSAGHLEVAANQGDAASLLQVKRGAPIHLVFGSDPKSAS